MIKPFSSTYQIAHKSVNKASPPLSSIAAKELDEGPLNRRVSRAQLPETGKSVFAMSVSARWRSLVAFPLIVIVATASRRISVITKLRR